MKARDIMHRDATCVPADETLDRAAQLMRNMDVGALPICNDDRLIGMLTDRDIVVRCIAEGHDPSRVRAGDLAQGTPRWVSADTDVSEVLEMMEQAQIKRLPVIDTRNGKRLVGMICESDLARNVSDEQLAHFVEAVSVPH
ncbi:CBS domain-containing protein [Nocardia otitidiscaviarum]|nr:CBS domain-containing protein [Nocardia otitidiscaviarum]MBF6178109.1 CBS domain-containing protein [Nocardia otitidiscaviarum]MCP9623255.1 CBS domain-containing protein [Nocardia otitidiscaviarum]QDP83163.1 CBS domain-containing protein [Nocardia otitidiscaviarum]